MDLMHRNQYSCTCMQDSHTEDRLSVPNVSISSQLVRLAANGHLFPQGTRASKELSTSLHRFQRVYVEQSFGKSQTRHGPERL